MVFRVIDNSKNHLKINKKRKNFDIKHREVNSKLARESSPPATPGTSRSLHSFTIPTILRETVATLRETTPLREEIQPKCQMPSKQSVSQSLKKFAEKLVRRKAPTQEGSHFGGKEPHLSKWPPSSAS